MALLTIRCNSTVLATIKTKLDFDIRTNPHIIHAMVEAFTHGDQSIMFNIERKGEIIGRGPCRWFVKQFHDLDGPEIVDKIMEWLSKQVTARILVIRAETLGVY